MNGCQYCGGALVQPTHKSCQWCNTIIGEANCNGAITPVLAAAETMKTRADLDSDARRAHIQAAYDQVVKKT